MVSFGPEGHLEQILRDPGTCWGRPPPSAPASAQAQRSRPTPPGTAFVRRFIQSLTTTGLKNARPRHLSALCGPPGFRGSCCLHTGGGNGSVLRTDNQQHHGPPGNLFGRQIPQPRRTEPETLGVGPSGCSSSVLHVIRTEAIEFENRFRGMDATPSPDL